MEIMKGKRTKRSRQPSPLTLSIASTSSNVTETTPATSNEFLGNTEEEEDMANCLILLAQSRIPVAPTTSTFYQCRTCERCFSTFQALGGHRASHKKPRTVSNEEKKKQFSITTVLEDVSAKDTELTLQISSGMRVSRKSKVHECGICGAEFSSGQALGGHMRRHRSIPITPMTKRNVLSLDLNLPAPEDDIYGEPRFGFGPQEQVIAFSVSSLVDCPF